MLRRRRAPVTTAEEEEEPAQVQDVKKAAEEQLREEAEESFRLCRIEAQEASLELSKATAAWKRSQRLHDEKEKRSLGAC